MKFPKTPKLDCGSFYILPLKGCKVYVPIPDNPVALIDDLEDFSRFQKGESKIRLLWDKLRYQYKNKS